MQQNSIITEQDKKEIIKKLNAISPLDEYRTEGRLPWKMITQLFLVIFTTSQAIITLSSTTNYLRSQERVFYDNFISKQKPKEKPTYPRRANIFSLSQLQQHMNWSLNNYEIFLHNSLETTNNISLQLHIEVEYNSNINITALNNTKISIPLLYTYNISPVNFGPFDANYNEYEIKEYINIIKSFTIKYNVNTYVPTYFQEHLECFGWNVFQTYDVSKLSHFVVGIDIQRAKCQEVTELTKGEIFLVKFQWIHIIIIILSLLNVLFIVTTIRFKVKKNSQLKISIKNKETVFTWKDFVDKWTYINIIGNIIQLIGAILGLVDSENIYQSTGVIIGSGCLFAFMITSTYLYYNVEYSTFHEIIKTSLPNIFRFLIGLLPLFFGCVVFARCVFWKSERFKDVSSSVLALFSISNGDCLYDIVADLKNADYLFGQLFFYLFCGFFIVLIMNTFISIIQKTYVSTKMKRKEHWIYNYIKKDQKLADYIQFRKEINIKDKANVTLEELSNLMNKRIIMFGERVNLCNKLLDQIIGLQNEEAKIQLINEFKNEIEKIPNFNINILKMPPELATKTPDH